MTDRCPTCGADHPLLYCKTCGQFYCEGHLLAHLPCKPGGR